MTNEIYCSYELSKALKECGFDEPCDHYYTNGYANENPEDISRVVKLNNGSVYNHNKVIGADGEHISAVPLWQAQKWLREKWDLHIDVYPVADCSLDADGQVCEEWNYWTFDIMHVMSTRKIVEDEEQYGSYEEALSEGIASVLELIKEGE